MSELTVFAYESSAVRTIMQGDEPWFAATDVAKILGYKLATDMLKMLDDDEKGMHILHTLGGDQELSVISESGLYAATLKSRKPEAKKFRKWVTSEVLPSIRKTGGYSAVSPAPTFDNKTTFPSHTADRLVAADRAFRAFKRSAVAFGLEPARANQRAREAALRMTGVDVFAEMGVAYEATLSPNEALAAFLSGFDVSEWRGEHVSDTDVHVAYYGDYIPWCRDKGCHPTSWDGFAIKLRAAAAVE